MGYEDAGVTYVYGDDVKLSHIPNALYVGTDHNTTTYFNNQVYEITYK